MKNIERVIYEKNKAGAGAIFLFIILNIIYSIYAIKDMQVDYQVGIQVLIAIVSLLLGFLAAVKVERYSIPWCYVAIVIGVLQGLRVLFTPELSEESPVFLLNMVLLISVLTVIMGGYYSLKLSKARSELIFKNKISEETLRS